jgi:hypothetical protein
MIYFTIHSFRMCQDFIGSYQSYSFQMQNDDGLHHHRQEIWKAILSPSMIHIGKILHSAAAGALKPKIMEDLKVEILDFYENNFVEKEITNFDSLQYGFDSKPLFKPNDLITFPEESLQHLKKKILF